MSRQQPALAGMFDVPASVTLPTKANPVKVERDRLNDAAERVLAHLRAHGSATNVELSVPEIGGMRAVGRIHELRKRGHAIVKAHEGGGIWRYRLIGRR